MSNLQNFNGYAMNNVEVSNTQGGTYCGGGYRSYSYGGGCGGRRSSSNCWGSYGGGCDYSCSYSCNNYSSYCGGSTEDTTVEITPAPAPTPEVPGREFNSLT